MNNYIKGIKNKYVINKVQNTRIPDFKPSKISRSLIIFSGRVQKVGFRLEIYELAKRLNLTGSVSNMKNGDVRLEIQGEKEKILFLTGHMRSLKRAKVRNVRFQDEVLVNGESSFIYEP
ncbi:MAG TPA: acylphosphatase [Sedimentibacter sp.]|nr:acylphosphatase [Sedimentibacter sp.]HNZ83120.1 acylphosphatase [Sedimentibacter sp.]HOH69895.1 acylphosphatase [Sedimentibacter sp.]HPX00217.1 acylphosphatase [Sedimentibacter sp.]